MFIILQKVRLLLQWLNRKMFVCQVPLAYSWFEKKKSWFLFCFWKSSSKNRYEEGERKKKKNSYLSKTPATFSSRLESLNISEKGLICSLLNLSPLRKSMALSIRLLISSGPEWTCKACARWFGSRFIEFLVRAARV